MIYAPIYIITLNRDVHFKRCLESLKKNTWAKYTDVYIGLDYPPSDKYKPGYERICDYLKFTDCSCFHSFNIIRREKNYGMHENITHLKALMAQKYDRWISAEDDIEFAPCFLEYMDKCLEMFQDDQSVIAINGYAYDIPYVVNDGANILKQSCLCSTWGMGMWKSRYQKLADDLRDDYISRSFESAVKSGAVNRMIRGRYYDYMNYCISGGGKTLFTSSSDISIGTYIALKEMYVITPVVTKTRNLGFDGSGLYCQNIDNPDGKCSITYDYNRQKLDDAIEFTPVLGNDQHVSENFRRIDQFIVPGEDDRKRLRINKILYCLFGRSNTLNIYAFLRKMKKKLRR